MTSLRLTRLADAIGSRTSGLCAVHCAAMPALTAFLPVAGLSWLTSPQVETGLIGSSLGVAAFSLGRGFRFHHRDPRPTMIAGAAILAIAASRTLAEVWEAPLMVTGGLLLVIAHRVNATLCRRCCGPDAAGGAGAFVDS